MKHLMSEWDGTAYPEMVRNLPEVAVPIAGVRGWLLEGSGKQVVFFDIDPSAKVPPHAHCAQWGVMLEGEMSLTIGDTTHRIRKGDWYYIPEYVTHSAVFHSRVSVIDIFDAPDRYRPKTSA